MTWPIHSHMGGELMASDISLAVGDGARRMTYAELAAVRGISRTSAKRLAQRHHWGRQVGNDGVVRVTVPLSALVSTAKSKAVTGDVTPMTQPRLAETKAIVVTPDSELVSPVPGATSPPTSADVAGDVTPAVIPATEPLARAVETLREQLTIANGRADRAEQRVDEQQETIRHLRGLLAEERRRVLEILTGPRVRPWWRRLFR